MATLNTAELITCSGQVMRPLPDASLPLQAPPASGQMLRRTVQRPQTLPDLPPDSRRHMVWVKGQGLLA
jgi:hypothetical protein